MRQYLDLLKHVRDHGLRKDDRTGTGTISVFGYQTRIDLAQGFPLLTTKRLSFKSIAHELLWFLAGSTNIAYLKANGVRIWDEWADSAGELGPVYGHQWRSWPTPAGGHVDQIQQLVDDIRRNPDSRRLIVSAWNVADIPAMKLPPCHALFQFYVAPLVAGEARRRLSCQLYQRSSDCFLGVPFNWASYALLTHMIAHQCDLDVGDFIWSSGDTHLYVNHLDQVALQLSRAPTVLPSLAFARRPPSIFDYRFEDFELLGYTAQQHIKADVSV